MKIIKVEDCREPTEQTKRAIKQIENGECESYNSIDEIFDPILQTKTIGKVKVKIKKPKPVEFVCIEDENGFIENYKEKE